MRRRPRFAPSAYVSGLHSTTEASLFEPCVRSSEYYWTTSTFCVRCARSNALGQLQLPLRTVAISGGDGTISTFSKRCSFARSRPLRDLETRGKDTSCNASLRLLFYPRLFLFCCSRCGVDAITSALGLATCFTSKLRPAIGEVPGN
jgi:hypothetical protein